jgi:enoyl-CoA hydratase/carnithine racemase
MSTEAETAAPVLFEEIATASGHRIGIATLNQPAALNGLSLAMVDLLAEKLDAWEADPAIVVIALRGAGGKAFCAGGDLQSLYRSMKQGAEHNEYAQAFFSREYRLDYRIHAYPKPVLCWGQGIVMGGGMGLMAGASHRVVTETSRLAMPEISIGLFPDVGGTWMLMHAPGRTGRFLALTGANIGAADALYAGFADVAIAQNDTDTVFAALGNQCWYGDAQSDGAALHRLLRGFAMENLEPGPLQRFRPQIDACCGTPSLEDAIAALSDCNVDDPWWQRATATLAAGCPGSIRLSWELQQRASRLSLAEVFRLEFNVAMGCASHGDFAEGIRALLIDKDKQPRWNPATLAEADIAFAGAFIDRRWPDGHPLSDLGRGDPQRTSLL